MSEIKKPTDYLKYDYFCPICNKKTKDADPYLDCYCENCKLPFDANDLIEGGFYQKKEMNKREGK